MRAAVFCFSDSGAALADKICKHLRLEKDCIHRRIPDDMGTLFSENDALIFIGACGISVRAVAPFIKVKTTDPAVVVIDDQGKYAIPILSGHIGGANELARMLAKLIGAEAVITTATDIAGKFSADSWAVQNNCIISSMEMAKEVSAAILKKDIPVCSEYNLPQPLPKGLKYGESGDIGIYIGLHDRAPFEKTLRLIPRILTLGIGCRRGTEKNHLLSAVKSVFEGNGLDIRAVNRIASIDIKKDEEGLRSLAEELDAELIFYSAQELNAVEGDFAESDFVKNTVGTGNVCERSAMHDGGKLVVKKHSVEGVTVAASEKEWRIVF